MFLTFAAAILAFSLFIIFLVKNQKTDKKFSIPGPPLWEVIYRTLNSELRTDLHNTFTNWSKKYGKIYSLNFLQGRIYIVGDLELMKNLSSASQLSGRPDGALFSDMYEDGKKHGITIADGRHWEEIRRFTTKQLKASGWSRSFLEPFIMEDLEDFAAGLLQDGKKGAVAIGNWRDRFIIPVINALWRIATGEQLRQDDEELTKLISRTTRSVSDVLTNGSGLLFLFPWMEKLAPELSGYKQCREPFNKLCAFFSHRISSHKETYDPMNLRDFIDEYLHKIERTNDEGSAFYQDMGEKQLCGILADILLAGSDAPSVAMAWVILYLSKHREAQKLVQDEIDAVVGDKSYCSLDYRDRMPYCDAVISEVLRLSTFFPIGFGNCVLEDCDVEGISFKKGEQIIFNAHWIHRNPSIWGPDPLIFRPERFISNVDGERKCIKHPALVPFFTGKRMCIGDLIARDQLFLFVTNLFRKFNFEFHPEFKDLSTDPEPGYFWFPNEFKAYVKPREA